MCLPEGREALEEKWILRPSVDECSNIRFIIRQILQFRGRYDQIKHLLGTARPFSACGELPHERPGVIATHTEGNDGCTIAENGLNGALW